MKLLPKVKYFLLFPVLILVAPLFFAPSIKAADCPAGIPAEACAAVELMFSNNATPGPWYDQNPTQFASKVFGGNQDEIFGERYTYAQINWIINSIASMLNPSFKITNPTQLYDFINTMNTLLAKTQTDQTPSLAEYSTLGPGGLVIGAINSLYETPPASGIIEVRNIAAKFDIVQPAHAQGYGFGSLNASTGTRALWTATRNMSYLIMVILLIASGFLIMFRVKINPQTVVSLQTMIPKIIITMLLITFSFAIAGFVIDFVFIVIAAFVGMLSLSGGIINFSDVPQTIFRVSQHNYFVYIILQSLMPMLIAFVLGLGSFGLGLLFGAPTGGASVFVGTVVGIALGIVVFIYFLVVLFRIFIMLVRSYVTLLLLIVIGPLQIMLGLLPGQQGFGPWIRNVIANASVFAVVPIMLIIQNIISSNVIASAFLHLNDVGLGNNQLNLPFIGGSTGSFVLQNLVGFVILGITPHIAEVVRDALKVPAFKYGNAFMEPLGPARTAAQGGIAHQLHKYEQDFEEPTAIGSILRTTGIVRK